MILNRTYPQKERKIYLEAATVDLEKAEVQRGENQFPLTGKELTLLEKLAENAGRIVTTGSLCGAVCGEFWQGYESTLSTHIRHLREKIEENPSKPVSLITIKGVGYRLNIKGGEMMNTAERFFRRYIFSTIGIIALFFAVNLILLGSFFIIAYLNGVADSNFPIEDFSSHIVYGDGKLTADTQALETLHDSNAWAMILNDNGVVICEKDLPEELPRKYTATDIAMFSRWYLNDYPVNIWKRSDGLLVIGFIPGSVFNHYISTNTAYIWPLCIGIVIAFIINILLMIYLFIRNAHRIEKSMEPILNGIQSLSRGKGFHLEEKGELAEINAGLNRAGEYLIKKDNTRAEWIRGISHDICTPLSVIFGYACEIEDDSSLLKVIDTGCGISDSRLDLLNNGTSISSTQEENISIDHGLGLKIVQQIVKAHHGEIHFRKNSPHGLIVKISLPLI